MMSELNSAQPDTSSRGMDKYGLTSAQASNVGEGMEDSGEH
jgi:hypothetical protein